ARQVPADSENSARRRTPEAPLAAPRAAWQTPRPTAAHPAHDSSPHTPPGTRAAGQTAGAPVRESHCRDEPPVGRPRHFQVATNSAPRSPVDPTGDTASRTAPSAALQFSGTGPTRPASRGTE